MYKNNWFLSGWRSYFTMDKKKHAYNFATVGDRQRHFCFSDHLRLSIKNSNKCYRNILHDILLFIGFNFVFWFYIGGSFKNSVQCFLCSSYYFPEELRCYIMSTEGHWRDRDSTEWPKMAPNLDSWWLPETEPSTKEHTRPGTRPPADM